MRCTVCNEDPCQTPGTCSWESGSWKKAARESLKNWQPPKPDDLPESWEGMDVGKLWDALNAPRRQSKRRGGDAPESTYDALVWSLIYNNGWTNPLVRDANLRRLSQLSDRQVRELIAALKRKNCHPDLIADIETFL